MTITWEKLEIEDVSDCATCTARYPLEMFAEVKVKCCGKAWCHECGREYTVLLEDESEAPDA